MLVKEAREYNRTITLFHRLLNLHGGQWDKVQGTFRQCFNIAEL